MSKPNRLIFEKSPYLLQHAHNPVDWYPWGDMAFEKAKKEDKPIFLSIGYSTCYWCHVMEREVFEVEEIAKTMNEYFVNIKVDREERPDVDRVYMAAVQSFTGSGGWPMSMFLTPDLKPFYGATYVPPTSKFGLPGFEDLIQQIHVAWKTRRNEVEDSGEEIINSIRQHLFESGGKRSLDVNILTKAINQFKQVFDDDYGGFGSAPKFPRPVGFNFLLRAYKRFHENDALKMVVRTLMRISKGGIHDHLGGGFHRYSVDRFWNVPHFEKMLYDQAQLAISYMETFQIVGDKFFEDSAKNILDYVSRKLTDTKGGIYSAEDAESALVMDNPDLKEEGAFYVWERSDVIRLLGEENGNLFCYFFGVEEQGNAPPGSDPHKVFTNKNILYNARSYSDVSVKFDIPVEKIEVIIEDSRKKLFAIREMRPLPHLDDKILLSWNGLMITAFAKAFQVFGDKIYFQKAKNCTEFVLSQLFDSERNTLLHRYRDGESKYSGTLEDYAFFVQALLEMYESCFDEKYLEIAISLSDSMIKIFYDDNQGAFFDVSEDDKSILVRTKEDYDSAEPTGNSIAILCLLRLSQMTENLAYFNIAKKSLEYFSSKMMEHPYFMPQMLCTLDFFLFRPKQIIVAGKESDGLKDEMIRAIHKQFLPNKIVIFANPEMLSSKIPFLKLIVNEFDKTAAYVCENYACKMPAYDVLQLSRLLNE